MENEIDNMTDQEAYAHHVYVEGRGEALIAEGKVSGEPLITPKGIAEYDQLLASGFRPRRFIVRAILERYHGIPDSKLEEMTDLFME